VFTFRDARPRLTPRGRFLTLGVTTWSGVWDVLRTRNASGQQARWTVILDDQANVEAVAALLRDGAIRAVVGPRFPLERLPDAHRTLEARTSEGDVIIDIIPSTPRLAARSA